MFVKIKFEDKEISYTELFGLFFNKKENEVLILEDVNPFGTLYVSLTNK